MLHCLSHSHSRYAAFATVLTFGCSSGESGSASTAAASVAETASARASSPTATLPSGHTNASESRDQSTRPLLATGNSRCAKSSPDTPLPPDPLKIFAKPHGLPPTGFEGARRAGVAGYPIRVTLPAHGGFGAGCDCPPFVLDVAIKGEGYVIPTSVGGVSGPGVRQWNLKFLIVGYFSGADINMLDFLNIQGDARGKLDEEDSSYYPQLHPEFCLEAWCYAFHERCAATSMRIGPETADNFDCHVAAKQAAELASSGVPACRPEWLN
jgi:hypothetical protein